MQVLLNNESNGQFLEFTIAPFSNIRDIDPEYLQSLLAVKFPDWYIEDCILYELKGGITFEKFTQYTVSNYIPEEG